MRGFTLIELLVVIALIGVLGSVLLVIIDPLGQIRKGRDTQRKTDLAQIQRPLEFYYSDKGRYPELIPFGAEWKEADVVYMAKVPQDTLFPAQRYVYQAAADGSWYTLYVRLELGGTNLEVNCPTSPCNYVVSSPNAP
ncbi:MAG: prepilin-type N-terminal cleavage/methylation domain-containing protein [Candidatus Levybacteria bacterium]|nr:prepilin-type N-terminal cleavage/methylation domain-containing protein [Candidatus Levybacteria bacterium]